MERLMHRRLEINEYCDEVKSVAARILLSCASTPDMYWQPLLEAFYIWPVESDHIAFYYVIHQFLRASRYVYFRVRVKLDLT